MKSNIIVGRSYEFALRIIDLVNSLPKNRICDIVGRQLLKSGISIGANVEEAQSGYSKNDFTNKMSIAQKEARESNYWLRLLRDSNQIREDLIADILIESEELSKMLYSIVKTSKQK
ncbi:MAG: four helix bundle protein [Thermodesulfovibrionales bacterium]|nr:four helix bundle protein [Thermodesulfovibrionales bacterium]